MKKKILLLTLIGLIGLSAVIYASELWGSYKGNPIIRLTVNGVPTQVSDAPAFIYDNRTMIPIYLLKQAGIIYNWDQKSQTVDIFSPPETTPTNYDGIKKLSKVSEFYHDLNDLAVRLQDIATSLSNAYYGLTLNNSSALNDESEYLQNAIDKYNSELKEFNSLQSELELFNIDLSPGSAALKDFYDAIDYYKASLTALNDYSITNSQTDFNNYLSNSKNGHTITLAGRTKANVQYLYVMDRIQSFPN